MKRRTLLYCLIVAAISSAALSSAAWAQAFPNRPISDPSNVAMFFFFFFCPRGLARLPVLLAEDIRRRLALYWGVRTFR